MKFVTVATHSKGYFKYLLQSCERHNIKLDTLGWGEKFQGWVWRMDLIKKYYESLEPEEIVCFIDAYDVIILQDADEIEKRFLDTGARIVVAEDFNTDSFAEWKARWFVFGTCKDVRINAGTYMGYAGDLLWMMNTMCAMNDCDGNKKLDDQVMMTNLCQNVPFRFHIDTSKDIFLCMCFRLGMEIAGVEVDGQKMLTYKRTANPCILHGAGNANLDEVIKKLGYDIEEKTAPLDQRARIYYNNLIFCLVAIVIIVTLGMILFWVKHLIAPSNNNVYPRSR